MSKRACSTCVARTKQTAGKGKHKQCSRSTCKYGPKCWQHTIIQDGLRVKESGKRGAGMGLYAEKPFQTREVITKYTGKVMTGPQYRRKYPNNKQGAYTVQMGDKDLFVDAKKTNAGVARYANDCNAPSAKGRKRKHCNAVFAHNITDNVVELEANRPIRKGNEIFVNYGAEYWNKGKGKGKGKASR